MALSRLLLPKTTLHSCKMGHTHFTENIFVQHKLVFRKHFLGSDCRICEIIAGLHNPSKWFSSSSSASENVETAKSLHTKKLVEAAKEQRCVAVGSDLKEYIDTHQAVVPKAAEVQNKVAGSWYNLKDIVKNLKDKMLENCRFCNYVSSLTSNCTIDTRTSVVTREIPHNTEPESIVQCSEAISQSQSDEKVASVNTTSNIIEENSKYIISTTAYEVIKKHENEDDNRSDELESRVRVSVTITDSLGGESHISSGAASDMTRKATHKDMAGRTVLEDKSLEDEDWTKRISKSAEQVEPDNGHRQATEVIMDSEHSFGITSQLLSEASTTFDEDDSNKMVSVGNLNCQSEENMASSGETVQASSEVDEKSASSGSAQKAKRLVDLFTRSKNKRAPPEIDNNNILTPEKSLECSSEPLAEDIPNSFNMKGLINCIKELPRERLKITSQEKIITNKTDQVSTSGSIGRIQSAANLQMTDNKESQTSMKGHAMNEDDEVSGSIGRVLSQTDVQISKIKRRKTSLKGPALGKECKKSKGSNEKPSTVISFVECQQMVSVGNLNCQSEENMASSGETAQASSEVDEKSASSGSAQKAKRLIDLFTRSKNKRAAPEIDNNNILTPEKSLECSNEPLAEDIPNSFNIKGLINCIKELPRERLKITSQEKIITNKTDQVSTNGSIGRIQSAANLQMTDDKVTQTSMKGRAMNEDDEVSGSIGRVLSQTDGQISKIKRRKTSLKEPALGKECKKSKGSKEKPSRVISFVKALENTIITSSSSEDTYKSTYIPDLIGDPDAPVALIKNPTRTVMIKQLTKSISSRHLKEALSFCGSGLTSIFMDSSSSSTYVEFESEDAKERAIAKHSIIILGEKLLIFRIDSPRTTVVRISNLLPNSAEKVHCICNSFGEVRIQKQRNKDTIDVHFSLAEWPNMLKILNNLNGMEIAGSRVRAEPAPIFPPEILNILWNQSDERRHVKGVIRSLLQTLENPVGVPELADLMASTIEKNFK